MVDDTAASSRFFTLSINPVPKNPLRMDPKIVAKVP
jgi:hypothetical protein